MRRMRGRTFVAATAALAVAAGAGYAAIPSSSGAINGCYEKKTGILRVIDKDAGKNCLSFETPIAWSVQGPAGAPGASYSAGMGLELVGTEFRLGFDPATQTELDAANAARVTLQQQVNQLSAQSQLQATQIATLVTTVNALEGRLATVETQLAPLSGAITVTGSAVFVNRSLSVDGPVSADAILFP